MKFQINKKELAQWGKAAALASLIAMPQYAMAINLPIVNVICDIAQTFSGPILGAIAVILVVAGGLAIGFGETTLFKWASLGFVGLGIGFGAASIISLLGGSTSCAASGGGN